MENLSVELTSEQPTPESEQTKKKWWNLQFKRREPLYPLILAFCQSNQPVILSICAILVTSKLLIGSVGTWAHGGDYSRIIGMQRAAAAAAKKKKPCGTCGKSKTARTRPVEVAPKAAKLNPSSKSVEVVPVTRSVRTFTSAGEVVEARESKADDFKKSTFQVTHPEELFAPKSNQLSPIRKAGLDRQSIKN